MLSPPCSSNGDIVDITEYQCDTLFPELVGVEGKLLGHENNFTLDDDTQLATDHQDQCDKTGSFTVKKVLKVHVSQVKPKLEPISTNSIYSTSIRHHDYAASSNKSNNTFSKSQHLPKYVELEPDTGFAVCGPNSKNAVLARENRRKKKEYISKLEDEIESLKCEKSALSDSLAKAKSNINDLQEENGYLRSVIANETILGSLLKNIPTSLSASSKRDKLASNFSDANTVVKKPKIGHSFDKFHPGVCLHVKENSVSLEFCKKCNDLSQQEYGSI